MRRTALATGAGLACSLLTATADITYTIHASTDLEINGYAQIESQIFGLNAYEGANKFDATGPHGDPKGYEFLNYYGVDSIGMAGNISWVFPRGTNIFSAALECDQVHAWFDDPKSAWNYFSCYGGGDRYVQGRILPAIRKYTDSEPWLFIVGSTPFGQNRKGRFPTDWERWSIAATRYIGLALKADPEFTYVHLLNEPNSHWFKVGRRGTDYANFFLKAATAIHNAHPNIKIGGPVLCWPPTWPESQKGTSSWYTWGSYSRPLIDIAHEELDFFDFHAYNGDAEGDVLAGELHIITAYTKAVHDKWLRSAITESNFAISREQWDSRTDHYNLRTLPMIRQTMTLLKHPDKVFTRQIHDFSARLPGNYRFRSLKEPTPMMELYRIMKPLRGTRLLVDGDDSRIMIEAVRNDKSIVVAVFNQASSDTTIVLEIDKLPLTALDAATAEVLDSSSLRRFTVPNNKDIILSAKSLTVITYPLKVPLLSDSTVAINELFANGDSVMKTVSTNMVQNYEITIPQKNASGISAYLCFGIKGTAAQESWSINVGSESYTVRAPGPYCKIKLNNIPGTGKRIFSLAQISGTNCDANRISFVSLKIHNLTYAGFSNRK